MRIDELQIGNWVFDINNDIECRVDIKDFRNGGEYILDNYEPIPLTAEILEKNGWAKDGIFMTFSEDPNTKLAWTDRCGACLYKNGYHICDCGHVHTLQHAMKLCGIEKEIKL